MPLPASAARAFFVITFLSSLFFFFSFFIFLSLLFSLGIGNCAMLCNEWDEVTH